MRQCIQCGGELYRYGCETDDAYEKRKFCDLTCAMLYNREQQVERIEEPIMVSTEPERKVSREDVKEKLRQRRERLRECRELFRGMSKRVQRKRRKMEYKDMMRKIRSDPEAHEEYLEQCREYNRKSRMKKIREAAEELNPDYKRLKQILINKEIATDKDVWGALIVMAAVNCDSTLRRDIVEELGVDVSVISKIYTRINKSDVFTSKVNIDKEDIIKLSEGDLRPLKKHCEIGGEVRW